MAKIVLGKSGGRPVSLDLDILLRTRLLVQANSGGGKSWLIRRLAEQIFGKVPIIIIDPEGEFATLREKFPFFLVGKGGDTPADPRSAAILAHRLLELRASAVCDVYELKPEARHHWVRLFLEALIDAPKKLWGHLVLFLDEAHVFAPETKAGKSEAYGAVVDVATRGRKRGICLIPATQRLAKLTKDVTGELLNRLIGPTFEDVDLERALDLMAVAPAEKAEFRKKMRILEPGTFQAVGRAFGPERIEIQVGPVLTTHPELGSSKYAATPPPPPEKIKALLPKLADLPKEAEEKAKTETDLRAEIRSLKAQAAQARAGLSSKDSKGKQPAAAARPVKVEVPILRPADLVRLERAMGAADSAAGKIQDALGHLRSFSDLIRENVRKIESKARASAGHFAAIATSAQRAAAIHAAPKPPRRPPQDLPAPANGSGLDKAERAVLTVLGQYPEGCKGAKIALLAGYRWSGGFRNALSALRSKGFMTGGNADLMFITPDGSAAVGPGDPLPFGSDLVRYWLCHPSFGQAERKALAVLLEHPEGLTGPDLAEQAGYGWSGGFRNALSSLRTAGVLVGRNTERMQVCEELRGALV